MQDGETPKIIEIITPKQNEELPGEKATLALDVKQEDDDTALHDGSQSYETEGEEDKQSISVIET